MTVYLLREDIDIDRTVSYGFERVTDGRVDAVYRCIGGSKDAVQRLVDALDSLQPESCHLDDIVEDFLTDFYL